MDKRDWCWAVVVLAALAYGYYVGEQDRDKHSIPVALCPNYDSVRVHPTAWQAEQGRRIRTLPAPPCQELAP